ncbi:hypothetical protein CFOL_v3_20994 [Cephalotus follicularis]|uniref:CCHC-type domain-containing protein n=1 Tax=Cephalotus follicularis TaxID=3775 RepID=A0A1Q3CBR2_CEPFO|nr:hypothetical protein CFOL_v3_20994 [Cephalotus follicularis]
MRRKGSEGSSNEALTARGRNYDRNFNRSGDRSNSQGRSKSRDAYDKSKYHCWKCEKYGHLKKDRKKKSVNGRRQKHLQPPRRRKVKVICMWLQLVRPCLIVISCVSILVLIT